MINFDEYGISEEIFSCQCHNLEDMLIFELYNDSEPLNCDLTISAVLSPYKNIFKRIIDAVKHVFGRQTNMFSETMIRTEDLDRIIEIFTKYRELKGSKGKNNE